MSPWFHLYVIGTSIAASLSLFSLFRDFIKIHQSVLDFVNAWSEIVRPIADFLFSWAFEIFGFAMPAWLGDYLVIGMIIALGRLRVHYFNITKHENELSKYRPIKFISRTLFSFILWPVYLVEQIYKSVQGPNYTYPVSISMWVFTLYSPFIYFIILLLANYTAFFIWTGAAS